MNVNSHRTGLQITLKRENTRSRASAIIEFLKRYCSDIIINMALASVPGVASDLVLKIRSMVLAVEYLKREFRETTKITPTRHRIVLRLLCWEVKAIGYKLRSQGQNRSLGFPTREVRCPQIWDQLAGLRLECLAYRGGLWNQGDTGDVDRTWALRAS